MQENDVTQSNVKETKTDIIKYAMTAAIHVTLFRPVNNWRIKQTQFFSITYIGRNIQNGWKSWKMQEYKNI